MDFDDQGYREYSHIVKMSSTSEASRDCLSLENESNALTFWRVRDRKLSVARVATIFLPRIEIAWRDPSAASTGNMASALSASVVAPVIPVS